MDILWLSIYFRILSTSLVPRFVIYKLYIRYDLHVSDSECLHFFPFGVLIWLYLECNIEIPQIFTK